MYDVPHKPTIVYTYIICICIQKEGQCLHTRIRIRAIVTLRPDWHYWKQATHTGLRYTHLLFMFVPFLFFYFFIFFLSSSLDISPR